MHQLAPPSPQIIEWPINEPPTDKSHVLKIKPKHKRFFIFILGFGLGLSLYPVLLMITLGRSTADGTFDAAVILGARVYEDGTPSDALMDRMLAGIDLYNQNQAEALILSGGPGDGILSEPKAMRMIALNHGVPDNAIILDESGYNTASTARNTANICNNLNWERVVGVSHFYHTPRLKIALTREGLDTSTHSASMRGKVLNKLPIFMAREAVAWWAYVLGLK